jgi:hypothetical protein
VHTADLSAFAGCSGIPLNLLKLITTFAPVPQEAARLCDVLVIIS